MPMLIMINKPYRDYRALMNVLEYISRGGSGYCGGYGVDPRYAAEQMQMVKKLWGKESGRQIRHFILSFRKEECVDHEYLMMLGFNICRYYSGYQSIYGLHTDTDHLHLHFAVNTVSYKNGKMYAEGVSDWHRLRGYIQGLIPQWYVDFKVSNGTIGSENHLDMGTH